MVCGRWDRDGPLPHLDGPITLTGSISHHEISRYYSIIDVFALPRLPWRVCQLVTPLKPYEAMATGRALVVSDVGALREMVIEGRTGIQFQAGNVEALARVCIRLGRSPDERQALGEEAARWVRRERTWLGSVQKCQQAYDLAQEHYALGTRATH